LTGFVQLSCHLELCSEGKRFAIRITTHFVNGPHNFQPPHQSLPLPFQASEKACSRILSICGYHQAPDASSIGDAVTRLPVKKFSLSALSHLFTSSHEKFSAQNYWACSCYA